MEKLRDARGEERLTCERTLGELTCVRFKRMSEKKHASPQNKIKLGIGYF